jgi:DNA-binding response OmpR family regulator
MSAIETPALAPFKAMPSDVWMLPQVIESKARLLSVSDNPSDHRALSRMIDHNMWQLITANTCRIGIRRLAKGVDVVFCESSLTDGTWKDILKNISIASMEKPPQLVVTSRLADAYLWSEVLNLGGFDVLAKPLSEKEVRQVLEAISRYQRRRGERRVQTAGGV